MAVATTLGGKLGERHTPRRQARDDMNRLLEQHGRPFDVATGQPPQHPLLANLLIPPRDRLAGLHGRAEATENRLPGRPLALRGAAPIDQRAC